MTWNPLVPTARQGTGVARSRRFHNWATSQEKDADNETIFTISTLTAGLMTNVPAAEENGEIRWYGVNSRTGANTHTLNFPDGDVMFGGSWVTSITIGAPGSYVYMISARAYNSYRWFVISSYGAT